MAKLSAHGSEIGRITYKASVKAYFADGKVLKNAGFGWKLHAKVKDGISPRKAFENAKARRAEFLSNKPAYRAYLAELHAMAGVCKRWKLDSAIQLMHDDPDGVWSEVCDGYGDNISADIDEVVNICKLYKLAIAEMHELKAIAA
mgnify:CR=1 FL=1|jgi:hypothetical protein